MPMGGEMRKYRLRCGKIKAEQIRETGAKVIFVPCHNCIDQIRDLSKEYDLGIKAFAFRPPVGITNPVLGPVLEKRGMFVLNFSCRAFDLGNRRIKKLSDVILRKVRPDDIILLHDVMPPSGYSGKYLVDEIEKLVVGLKKIGFEILPISELIKRKIMVIF